MTVDDSVLDFEELIEDEGAENSEPTETEDVEIVDISELSPLVMIIRAMRSIDKMHEWAQDTKNGELMGQAAAGYLEIHDRLAELEEEEERAETGFGFKSHLGGK